MSRPQFRRSVRMNEADQKRLLDQMDGSARAESTQVVSKGADARQAVRFEYRINDLPVAIEHPGGGISCLLVSARNISTGGVAFVHGGFLHAGTRCCIILRQRSGERMAMKGQVVNSRHVRGSVHEVSVSFNERIDIEAILSPDAQRRHAIIVNPHLQEVEGQLLYLEPRNLDVEPVRQFLLQTRLELQHVRRPGDMLDALRKGSYAAVLTDIRLGKDDPFEVLGDIRRVGHQGPVVVITSERDEEKSAKARAAGATHILNKPCRAGSFFDMIEDVSTWLREHPHDDIAGPETGEESMQGDRIADEEIDRIRAIAEDLEAAISEQSLDTIRSLCEEVRLQYPTHFAELADAASSTLASLEGAEAIDDVREKIEQFALLCASASNPGRRDQ